MGERPPLQSHVNSLVSQSIAKLCLGDETAAVCIKVFEGLEHQLLLVQALVVDSGPEKLLVIDYSISIYVCRAQKLLRENRRKGQRL